MDFQRFLAELKRRRVYRVAVTYAIALFAAVQLLEALVGFFPVLNSLGTALVVIGLIGFPLAVILAWIYDITPQGVRRTAALEAGSTGETATAVTAAEARASHTLPAGRAAGFVGVGVLVAVVGLAAVSHWSGPLPPVERVGSIAVLPFTDLSTDHDQQVFGDGIADELLNRLAQGTELQVAARASAFSLRGQELDVMEVGRRLRVDAVLDGTIRTDGEHLRVSAQLSDARSGRLIWSASYDREEANLLELQDELALAIVDALQLELSAGGRLAAVDRDGRTAPERLGSSTQGAAYDLYSSGMEAWHRRTEASVRQAIAQFEEAVELDPSFALAHAGLAQAYAILPQVSSEPPRAAAGRAKEAAATALGLEGLLPEAHVAMGQIRQNYDWRPRQAESSYRRAIEANPSYATAHQWYAETLLVTGRYPEALAEIDRAVALDPLSPAPVTVRGYIHTVLGDHAAALTDFRRVAAASPGFTVADINHGATALLAGEVAEARAAFARLAGADRALGRALAAVVDGATDPARRTEGVRAAAGLRGRLAPALVAVMAALVGDDAAALDMLTRAYEERSDANLPMVIIHPVFAPLRADTGFHEIVERLGVTLPPLR